MVDPPFGKIAKPLLEVANCEFPPLPVPQAIPLDVTWPFTPVCKHPNPVERKRFVVLAVFAKSVVVVAFVVVLFTPVKFWKVEDAFARRLPNVPRPAAVSVPVKLAAEEMV